MVTWTASHKESKYQFVLIALASSKLNADGLKHDHMANWIGHLDSKLESLWFNSSCWSCIKVLGPSWKVDSETILRYRYILSLKADICPLKWNLQKSSYIHKFLAFLL